MLKARECIRELREYQSPIGGEPCDLRLDMNENTTGCSSRVLAMLRSLDAKRLALYAAREPGEKLVADFLKVDPSLLLLTNGADEGIDLLSRAYIEPGDEMIIMVPAFAMYEIFGRTAGAKIIRVPAGPEFQFPSAAMLQAVTSRTRVIVITNPNNPTGVPVARAEILRILEAAPQAAVLLDEAYFDFYGQTMLDQVGKIPNLFVARTFSKAYGLAGVRLGVLTGAGEQMSLLRRMCPPFNVNAIALECLADALADQESVAQYVQQIKATREWLKEKLEDLGLKSWPSQTNFLLCRLGPRKGEILAALRNRGISLRDRPDCEGCVRITIGKQNEMDRVLAAIKEILPAIARQTAGR